MVGFPWLAFTALGFAIVSLALHLRPDSVIQIARRLRSIELEVADIADRTSTWMKRESVRNAREKKAEMESSTAPTNPELARLQKKAEIRSRAASFIGRK